jgi:hypothetical protein
MRHLRAKILQVEEDRVAYDHCRSCDYVDGIVDNSMITSKQLFIYYIPVIREFKLDMTPTKSILFMSLRAHGKTSQIFVAV